jgi:hypothetical protein
MHHILHWPIIVEQIHKLKWINKKIDQQVPIYVKKLKTALLEYICVKKLQRISVSLVIVLFQQKENKKIISPSVK